MPTRPLITSILRAALTGLISLGLSGCAMMSTNHYTTLPKEDTREDATLPVPVAFIIYASGHSFSNRFSEYQREADSWVLVLSDFTARENIYVSGAPNMPHDPPPAFLEFSRTHPLVKIVVGQKPRPGIFAISLASITMNVITYGLLPTPTINPTHAEFTLTLPGGRAAQPVKHDYSYYRLDSFAPLFFLLPLGNDNTIYFGRPQSCSDCAIDLDGDVTKTDWRAEEKRRLLAKFLRDAMPLLKQYGQQARSQQAANVAEAPVR